MDATGSTILWLVLWWALLMVQLPLVRLLASRRTGSMAFDPNGFDLDGYGRRLTRAIANCQENIPLYIGVLLFAMLFRYVPDVRVPWRDVWIGAVVTAVLFSIGTAFMGRYLGQKSFSSIFGAAGSLMVILLWVYYSSQIVFFGAEFTRVYSNMFGSNAPAKTKPLRDAA